MLEQLAQLLKTRKGKYILFLGAGASVTSGSTTTKGIVAGIVEKYRLDSRDPWNSFCDFLKRKGEDERFDIFFQAITSFCLMRFSAPTLLWLWIFSTHSTDWNEYLATLVGTEFMHRAYREVHQLTEKFSLYCWSGFHV